MSTETAKTTPPSPTGAFVFGTGRCGSTMVPDMLARHSDIARLSEIFTFLGTRALPSEEQHLLTSRTEEARSAIDLPG